MERLVPRLRFSGFTGAWDEKKFSKLVSRRSKSSSNKTLPRIEYEDINSGLGSLKIDVFEKDNKHKKGIFFENGDILYGKLRPYLKNWFLPLGEGVAVGDFWVLKPTGSDSKFVYYLIQTNQFYYISNISTGTKMPRSDWSLVSNREFLIPTLPEQEKIGQVFARLDSLLDKQEKYINSYKDLKKGLIQRLFPKEGQSQPALRFPGFAGDWEEVRIGHISVKNTKKNKDNKIIYVESVSNKHGLIPQEHQFDNRVASKNLDNYYIINHDMFVYNPSRINVGSLGYKFDYKTSVVSPLYISFSIMDSVNNMFFLYWLKTDDFAKQRDNHSEGSVRKTLSYEAFSTIKIKVPTLPEQEKIGQVFASLDKKIQREEEKLRALKDLKRGLLQKLFI
ncbi:MAG: restriction endonuclease subunit S [Anaerococcus sp.]|nr:restriction endonuclease subunit S [Anaerococcus sp.]